MALCSAAVNLTINWSNKSALICYVYIKVSSWLYSRYIYSSIKRENRVYGVGLIYIEASEFIREIIVVYTPSEEKRSISFVSERASIYSSLYVKVYSKSVYIHTK